MTPSRRRFLATAAAVAAGIRTSRAGGANPAAGPNPAAEAVNGFGFDLYGKLRSAPGNAFFSPFSVAVCLNMTAAGAKGTTREEMVNVLHTPADDAAADAGFKALLGAVNGVGPAEKRGYQLSTANAVWAQQGYPWRPEFKARVADGYGAGLLDADFAADADGWRKKINEWVERETRDKIKDLLRPETVTSDTRMVLANAVYFKGDWAAKFDPKLTASAPFTAADGSKTAVPLMHRSGHLKMHQDDDLQVAEFPYKGDAVTMTVILPRRPDRLAAVEAELTPDRLAHWTKRAVTRAGVETYLPKFKVETEYKLNDPLQDLGMKAAFDQAAADFTGMHSGTEKLSLSLVAHKAFVDVNEEGTEAAAATGAVMVGRGLAQEPPTFRADRPFLFLIRHAAHGTVLFLGRYEKPTA
jgi:serpin B